MSCFALLSSAELPRFFYFEAEPRFTDHLSRGGRVPLPSPQLPVPFSRREEPHALKMQRAWSTYIVPVVGIPRTAFIIPLVSHVVAAERELGSLWEEEPAQIVRVLDGCRWVEITAYCDEYTHNIANIGQILDARFMLQSRSGRPGR